MWDTWFARLPAGILKMPDWTLEYFEYLRPTFSLKSLLGLLIIKEEKVHLRARRARRLPGCFSGLEKVEWINPASCYGSTALFRATWSLWATNPSISCHPDFKPQQPCSLASFLFSLHSSFMVRIVPVLGWGVFSLCPSRSSNVSY